MKPINTVCDEIAAERVRQRSEEGWSEEHDDQHTRSQLAVAASCYAVPPEYRNSQRADNVLGLWPWNPKWWKPGDRRRELIKAAALLVAEIERLDRASAS